MKKILITCSQVPFYGGAGTNSYALIKYFREHGHKVAGIFFDNTNKSPDPDKIGGIWKSSTSNNGPIKREVIKYLDGEPDIVFSKNYAAPVISKGIFPDTEIIYLVTGSPQMMELSQKQISARKFMTMGIKVDFKPERDCIRISKKVIPNSNIAKELLIKNYGSLPKFKNPIDTSMSFNNIKFKNNSFKGREYDFTFICSNLDRTVKNSDLAFKVFKNFPNSNKIVVGLNNSRFKTLPNTTVLDFLDNSRVIDILSRTKLTLCTSYYDASPNVIKEALLTKSNILLSRNCGWSEVYPSEFVCKDVYNIDEWTGKANHLISNPIEFDFMSLKDKYSIYNIFKAEGMV